MTDNQPINNERVEGKLGKLDEALDQHDYPTTTDELTEVYGSHEVQSQRGVRSLKKTLEKSDKKRYASTKEVQNSILKQLNRK
jgi:hypothetical protein